MVAALRNMVVTDDPADIIWKHRQRPPLEPYRALKAGEIEHLYADVTQNVADIHLDGKDCTRDLVLCNVSTQGILSDACLMCNQQTATCVHYDSPVAIKSGNNIMATYPPNVRETEGYCTPVISGGTDGARTSMKVSALRECHPNTGDRYLTKLDAGSDSYMFTCVCKDPLYFTQSVPLVSNCSVPVSCESTGGITPTVDILNSTGRPVDPGNVSCINCGLGTKPGHDPRTRLPICVSKGYHELNGTEEKALLPPFPMGAQVELVSEAKWLDPRVRDAFVYPNERHIINPCSVDPFTGEALPPSSRPFCQMMKTERDEYYCWSGSPKVLYVRRTHNILRNNNGRAPDGCWPLPTGDACVWEYWNAKPLAPVASKHGKQNDDDAADKRLALPIRGVRIRVSDLLESTKSVALRVLILARLYRSENVWVKQEAADDTDATGKYDGGDMIRRTVLHFEDDGTTAFVSRRDNNSSYPIIIGDAPGNIYMFVYDSVALPALHNAPAVPSNLYRERGTAGLPISTSSPSLLSIFDISVIIPFVGPNRDIDCLACDDIGNYFKATFSDIFDSNIITKLSTAGEFLDHLNGASFVACLTNEPRIPIAPNLHRSGDISSTDYQYTTGILILSGLQVIRSLWLGDPNHIPAYIEHLPALPQKPL